MTITIGDVLLGPAIVAAPPEWTIRVCNDARTLAAYRALRREVFVAEQGLFASSDADEIDDRADTVVLVACAIDGQVIGGVRLAPATDGHDIGWWTGSRLVVSRTARTGWGIGSALVRAACAHAEQRGAIRFDANVQLPNVALFESLGWRIVDDAVVAGVQHRLMQWPINRIQQQSDRCKSAIGDLIADLRGDVGLGGDGFVGDDGAPVAGTDVIAACDAILPTLVERNPEWAGWCGVLVNINDLTAMGAEPVGLLDAVAARDASFAARIIAGLRDASQAWGVPVIGGHTQLGVAAALSVTALGRTRNPVPAAGGRAGHRVTLTADLGGQWRPGFTGAQWDSTTSRRTDELRQLAGFVGRLQPAAAKDVSMAGIVGTLGMLAEASDCGAVLDVASVPTPEGAGAADWLTCFPGFAMLTTDVDGRDAADPGVATTKVCGELSDGAGVVLRWPDCRTTTAIDGAVTGLGAA